ncbi:MAG: hypothetical protein E5X28_09240, partial [Mesorhizobium sp.]
MDHLNTPKFTQPDVLKLTRVKPTALQNWTNRKAIELAVQNPGYGKPRLYTALDVVKIAIMRRLADLRVDLSVAKEIAEATAMIVAGPRFDDTPSSLLKWDSYLFMRPEEATEKVIDLQIAATSPLEVLDKYGLLEGLSPEHWRLTQIAFHLGEGTGLRRSATADPYGPIDDAK